MSLRDLIDGLLASAPPPGDPDLGPGMAERRAQALDADAQRTTSERPLPPAGPPEGERRAAASLDEELEEARRRAGPPRP